SRPGNVVLDEEEDHSRVDHQPVGKRVEDPAEGGLHAPASREEAVDLISDAGDTEDDPGGPAVAAVSLEHQDHEDRNQRQARDRQRVGKLLHGDGNGTGAHGVERIRPWARPSACPDSWMRIAMRFSARSVAARTAGTSGPGAT